MVSLSRHFRFPGQGQRQRIGTSTRPRATTLSFQDVPSCGPLSAFWTCRLGTHLELSGRAALWSILCFPDPHRDGWGEFQPIEVHVSIGLRKTVENAFQNTQRIYRNQPCVKLPKREPGAEPTMDGWEFLPPISVFAGTIISTTRQGS